jgi:deoxycytidylate deaminase
MQNAGNQLRERFGPNYLAEKAVERIAKFRKDYGGYDENNNVLPGRRAYIIDSIKNREELTLLRSIYRDTLCVFGVFAPDKIRKQRLIDSGGDKLAVDAVISRDEGEVQTFGQMTRKIFVESDFFICNDQKEDELRRRIKRYLEIVFGTQIHTPTRHESAMYEAGASMVSSACLSRQVGASIVSASGELIAVGWNDVPKFKGGIYNEDDQMKLDGNTIQDGDHRCFKWAGKICHNEMKRNAIGDNIASAIFASGLMGSNTTLSQVREIIAKSEINDLIEFSRSIHAEMEAILSVAREGKHSLVGATMYTTTYPCHNCARHIVAAGITAVFYIEPYKKSQAVTLHYDAISEDPAEISKFVVFRQYDGVAPHHYLHLFKMSGERKKEGRVIVQDAQMAVPLFRIPLDGPVEYESKVIADLEAKEESVH